MRSSAPVTRLLTFNESHRAFWTRINSRSMQARALARTTPGGVPVSPLTSRVASNVAGLAAAFPHRVRFEHGFMPLQHGLHDHRIIEQADFGH